MGGREVVLIDGVNGVITGAAVGVTDQWTGQNLESQWETRDQQRATVFIWEFGLHIGQLFMHAAAMQLRIVDARQDYGHGHVRSEQRGSCFAECGCALSFVLSPPLLPSASASASLSHVQRIIPSAPTASARLKVFACSVAASV
jgi:hypothetical protein